MIINHRVSLGFAKFKKAKLAVFASSVTVALTNNPAFPNLPVSAVDLKAASDSFANQVSLARLGGIIQTAQQSEARTRLISLLRTEAHYVQIVAGTSLSTLLSSGFTATNRNSAQLPLVRPFIRKLLRQQSTELRLILKPVRNARSYQVQFKAGDGDWQEGGFSNQARKLVVAGLTPGTVYQIRVRALGGSTGQSEWSPVASCMAV